MKLTTFTDYSLRVLMYLAAAPERRATISDICEAFHVKQNHMTKVVHHLGKCGWVATMRGKGGGLLLAKPAEEIWLGDVVRDTEGQAMPAECFGESPHQCAIVQCCDLKGVLGEAVRAFYAVLDGYTLADITTNKRQLSNVLHFQRPAASAAA